MKTKKISNLEMIAKLLQSFRYEHCVFLDIEFSRKSCHVIVNPGAENMFSGLLLGYIYNLCCQYDMHFFVATNFTTKPYIVIFPKRNSYVLPPVKNN